MRIEFALPGPTQVIYGDQAVWVNTGVSCIGRFSRRGIDVHRELNEALLHGECLYCTHSETDARDWPVFVAKMREHHTVDLSGLPQPWWLPLAPDAAPGQD